MSGRLVALCEAIATEEMAAAAEELAAIPNHDVTRDSLFRYAVKQTMKLGVYSTNIAHDISVEFTLYKVMYFFVEACCSGRARGFWPLDLPTVVQRPGRSSLVTLSMLNYVAHAPAGRVEERLRVILGVMELVYNGLGPVTQSTDDMDDLLPYEEELDGELLDEDSDDKQMDVEMGEAGDEEEEED